MGRVAVGAVHGSVIARLERHLGLLATMGAHGGEHFPPATKAATTAIATRRMAKIAPLRFARRAALGTAARLVGEALLCEEFLFANRKDEFAVTITAREGFVLPVDNADPISLKYLERSVSAITIREG